MLIIRNSNSNGYKNNYNSLLKMALNHFGVVESVVVDEGFVVDIL